MEEAESCRQSVLRTVNTNGSMALTVRGSSRNSDRKREKQEKFRSKMWSSKVLGSPGDARQEGMNDIVRRDSMVNDDDVSE